jgi:hypothetical protein
MIGDLKSQKLVDGRQCFFVPCCDPHSAAALKVFIPVLQLRLQDLEVSALGLGCMSMSSAYGPPANKGEMPTWR